MGSNPAEGSIQTRAREGQGKEPEGSGAEAILKAELEGQAVALARAIDNPEVIAKKLGEMVAKRWPDRVRSAWWVTVSGDPKRDKGMEIAILRRPVGRLESLRLSAVVGRETIGAGLFADVWEGQAAGRFVTASVGIGGAKPYAGGRWEAFVGVSVRL